MGCGKSTVGKLLSSTLNLPYIDLDEYIENQYGKTIQEIFQDEGEISFRKYEYEAVKSLMQSTSAAIVSLGGGTPCYFDTMDQIMNSPHASVYLQTSIPTLSKRLFNERAHRPLINHISSMDDLNEFIGKHLFERSPFYLKAQIKIVTDNHDPEVLAQKIQESLA